MRRLLVTLLLALYAVLPASVTYAAGKAHEIDFITEDMIPPCWSLTSLYAADPERVAAASVECGVAVTHVDMAELLVGNTPLEIVAYHFERKGDAARALDALAAAADDGRSFARADLTVLEFAGDNRHAITRIRHALGIEPHRTRVWKVTMEVAPEYRGDDRYWGQLYAALQTNHEDPDNQDAVFQAIDLAPRFAFDTTLVLPGPDTPWGTPEYEFAPAPSSQDIRGDQLSVTFDRLPIVIDVPRVTVTATIPTRSFSTWESTVEPDLYRLNLKTDPWPWTHQEIQKRLKPLMEGKDYSLERKVEEILCWIGSNLDLDGDSPTGRSGMLATLREGRGYAWDFNDVFVSMCRFVDVPTRQVYGWLVGHGPHVWTRVYDPERNVWFDVDVAFGWIGVSEEYIPLFTSDIGHPPFLFTRMPEIELVSETIVE